MYANGAIYESFVCVHANMLFVRSVYVKEMVYEDKAYQHNRKQNKCKRVEQVNVKGTGRRWKVKRIECGSGCSQVTVTVMAGR